MSAPRTAVWLFGLGCLALVSPVAAWAIEEPQAAQAPQANVSLQAESAAQPVSAQADPAPQADLPAVEAASRSEDRPEPVAHAAPRVSITFGDGRAEPATTPPPPAAETPAVVAEHATPDAPAAAPEPSVLSHVISPAPPAASLVQAEPQPAAPPAPVAASEPAPASDKPVTATVAAPPAATVVADAAPVAAALEARLRDLGSVLPRRFPAREREALASYYTGAHFQPVWVANGTWTSAAKAVIAQLKQADADGLDPAEYPVPLLGLGTEPAPRTDNPAELAEAEVKLSAAAILYARDARGGRIEPTRLSALITPKLELPSADAVLTRLSAAGDPGAALGGYNPAYPGYAALKAKLATIRANRPAEPMVLAPQRRSGGKVASLDGTVPSPRLEGDLIANMERWRWLPSEVGSRYIFVNIPQFRLSLFENGRVVHEARVITGKPQSPTPIFSGEMEYAVVNPSWYIPPSIMKNEILPGLAADPEYATRRGYEVVRRGKQVYVRQPPGERNALGFIKFMFPNQHAVYLHDTPNRNLFSASMRAFSHGCVRVEQPFALADFVLGHAWSEQRLKKLIGRGERTIRMDAKLPVHLAYFTTMVEPSGEVRSYGDLYGINRRVRLALGLGG
jgi:murein L,D-transpeptidase YcbB/YkuD